MIFDNDQLTRLRNIIKSKLSEKRYIHTLGVEMMSRILGDVIIPDMVDELSVAALLHDIAKELSYDQQIALIEEYGNVCTKDDLSTKPALHSFAAVPLIKRDYPEYATDNVLSAVANHTLGAPGMSVFDEIIFISDYAENGRTYHSCLEVNKYLLNNIKAEKSYEDNLQILHKAALMAVNSTVDSLTIRQEKINKRTLLTKKYLEENI